MSTTSPDDRISEFHPVTPTTQFPADFPVFDNSDLVVVHNGLERTDFAVSATYVEGVSNDARAIFDPGLTGNVKVVGSREPRRSNRFGDGPVSRRDLNLAFDTIQAETQELARDRTRSLKVAYGIDEQPSLSPDAGKVIGWSSGGELTNLEAVPEGSASFAAFGLAVAGMATAAEFEAAFTFNVWNSGAYARLKDRFNRTYCILDAPGSPDPTGQHDSYAALQAMIDGSIRCELTKGKFVTSKPLLMKTTGQQLFGQGQGFGYGRPDFLAKNWGHQSTIVGVGTFPRRVLTRRNHRASAADPKDTPMSAIIERHADGIVLSDFAIFLDCDWTNLSPSNYGADIDIGLFSDGRPGNIARNVAVIGHFRKTAFLLSYTRALNLPQLLDLDGNPLPIGASGDTFAGADLWVYDAVRSFGMCSGFTLYGPKHPGGSYYDEATGLVSDDRGASGASSGSLPGLPFFWVTHQSGQRKVNPIGYGAPLTRANMEAEPDFTPAAVDIDGWAGNAGSTTTGRGQVRNIVFDGLRLNSIGPFRFRMRDADQVHIKPTSWMETGDHPAASGVIKDAGGATINVSDYVNVTYGQVATSTISGQLQADDLTGGLDQTWIANPQRLSGTDAFGRRRAKAYESGTITITDDAVGEITPPANGGFLFITFSPDTTGPQPQRSGGLKYDCGSGGVSVEAFGAGANFATTTSDVTGTTGVDGNLTISVRVGLIKIENRAGGAAKLRYTFI